MPHGPGPDGPSGPGTWALDLDGVVWRGEEPLPGAAATVARLRDGGHRVVFISNNSNAPLAATVAKLGALGIQAGPEDVLTSARAAASMLEPGTTALVFGGPGVVEALAEAGVATVADGPADAVVVGWHREFDYDRLSRASRAVREGARFVATNDDATYPMAGGLVPGAGSLVAAVSYASGEAPEVAGKPHEPMVSMVRRRVGPVAVMVGDRPDTDGRMARRLGARFGLVLTGVTTRADLPVDPTPDAVAADLAALVDARA